MNSGISVKIQIWPRLPHISANQIARFWNHDISWISRYLVNFSNFLQRVTFPWPLSSELRNFGQNSNLIPFTPYLGQWDRSVLKSRYLVNRWSDFSNFLQRVTFPTPPCSELMNFGQNSNLIPFTAYLGHSDRSSRKSRYLVNRQSDFSIFLQRVTFPWPLNSELTHFGQNSNLIPFTPYLGQSDHSVLKSRYPVNRSSDFSNFCATSYFSVTSKQWIEEFWSKFKFHPSLGQSGRSILKSRYLVNRWSYFSNFLQRVTFPWPLNSELIHFGKNSNFTRLSANQVARFWNLDISWTVGPIFLFLCNELHFRDL